MKSIFPKKTVGLTVGAIIDAMAKIDEFKHLGRETIFSVVEIFLKEYVGMPGSVITRKFTPESADEIASRLNVSKADVVKIVTIFRIRAGTESGVKTKIMKAFGKVRASGGGIRSTPMSKL
jgi:hypothetical protein